MGTQIHASENYRRVVELIQSGVIGPVSEAHVWVSRAWGLQSEEDAIKHKDRLVRRPSTTESMAPPDYLDWDLWLGPAPQRPFHEVYFPGPNWYRWWDFGNGTMSDLGSHWNDLPFWALRLDAPRTVESFGPPPHPEIAPASMTAVYEYGPRGNLPAVSVTWYQGTHKPKIWERGEIPAVVQWRAVRRQQGHVAFRLPQACSAAGRKVRSIHAAAAGHANPSQSSPGVAFGLLWRRDNGQSLLLRGAFDRSKSSGQRRLSRGQENRLGLPRP